MNMKESVNCLLKHEKFEEKLSVSLNQKILILINIIYYYILI